MRTASHTASDPHTHKTLSCWPANVASALSSPTALERTATGGDGTPTVSPSSAYRRAISSRTSPGIGGSRLASRYAEHASANPAGTLSPAASSSPSPALLPPNAGSSARRSSDSVRV